MKRAVDYVMKRDNIGLFPLNCVKEPHYKQANNTQSGGGPVNIETTL